MKIIFFLALLFCSTINQVLAEDPPNLYDTATEKIDILRDNIAKAIAPKESIINNPIITQKQTNLKWKNNIKQFMPEWAGERIFFFKNGQWLALLLIIFFAFIIEKFVRRYASNFIKIALSRQKIELSDKKLKQVTFPLGLMTMAIVWTFSVKFIELPTNILDPLLRAGNALFAIASVFATLKLINLITLYFEKLAKSSESSFDDILVPLVSKTLKSFTIIIGAVYVGNSLTLDMKGIVAGLGLGGFAFALAAKDTISNIFGSVTVLLDRPFRIGDWVLIDDKIEGTVEEVGLRSTKIRTFYDSLISLPNGSLTNVHIDNYGKREYRRYTTNIGIQYDTPSKKIEEFCEGIKELIRKHEYTRKDYFHVYLNSLGSSSLNILLYVFWKVPDWSKELEEKHRLLVDILALGKKIGVEFAFPTQTLHISSVEQTLTNP